MIQLLHETCDFDIRPALVLGCFGGVLLAFYWQRIQMKSDEDTCHSDSKTSIIYFYDNKIDWNRIIVYVFCSSMFHHLAWCSGINGPLGKSNAFLEFVSHYGIFFAILMLASDVIGYSFLLDPIKSIPRRTLVALIATTLRISMIWPAIEGRVVQYDRWPVLYTVLSLILPAGGIGYSSILYSYTISSYLHN